MKMNRNILSEVMMLALVTFMPLSAFAADQPQQEIKKPLIRLMNDSAAQPEPAPTPASTDTVTLQPVPVEAKQVVDEAASAPKGITATTTTPSTVKKAADKSKKKTPAAY